MLPRFIYGLAIWPFIFVQPYFSRHCGLIEHEPVHFREQKMMLVIPWFLGYVLSKRFRRDAELREYRHQIAIGGISYRETLDLLR